jgi:A/G-specific adenine glycosylase
MKNLETNTQHKNADTQFIKRVLEHYQKHGRHNLLWRKSPSAYPVLVSEIMLQQTQVARVIEKYALWMKTYPTLKSLSTASFRDILVLWQGLGYQRRAKALYMLAKEYKRIPTSFEELCKLPGIGPYTASAVCAFAYDRFSHPMLETNIRTALIEEFHLPAQAGQWETKIHDGMLYDDLTRLVFHPKVQKVGARIWYYALMDYGAHLKASRISHNTKSAHYTKQSTYKGSVRELRAKILFALTYKKLLPKDERTKEVVQKLIKEGYITKRGKGYKLSN